MIPNEVIKDSIKSGYMKGKVLKCTGVNWGYVEVTNHGPIFVHVPIERMALDLTFWKCLAKARNWSVSTRTPFTDEHAHSDEWTTKWDEFFSLLRDGQSTESFWNEVLKK